MTRPGKWLELAFDALYFSMPVVTVALAYVSVPFLAFAYWRRRKA
jgi:hypothetical protein